MWIQCSLKKKVGEYLVVRQLVDTIIHRACRRPRNSWVAQWAAAYVDCWLPGWINTGGSSRSRPRLAPGAPRACTVPDSAAACVGPAITSAWPRRRHTTADAAAAGRLRRDRIHTGQRSGLIRSALWSGPRDNDGKKRCCWDMAAEVRLGQVGSNWVKLGKFKSNHIISDQVRQPYATGHNV